VNDFAHDVFISYSHKDKEWVSDVLVKMLRENRLDVLVDESDFEAGLASIENMTDSVERSRRTIAVLTPNWVESEWTRFEGLLTAQEDPTGGRGRLIPILRQQCSPPKWISIRSYLDFVDDARVSNMMARLVRTLRRPLLQGQVVRTEAVDRGLRTLADMIESGPVRDMLIEYRFRFENIISRIERVVTYKGVHDQLHHIQLHCYDAILRDAPRLAMDESAVDSIDFYAKDLRSAIGTLRKLDACPVFESARLAWIATLQRASDILAAGVEARSEAEVKKAAGVINRVLVSEPPRIDARLSEAATELELQAVTDAVTFVCQRGEEAAMEPEKLARLREARDVMEQLDENLALLVRSHFLWQDVDVVMRRVDTNIDADTFELVDEWPELRRNVEVLSATAAAWARDLRAQAKSVDDAIAENDAGKMARQFRRYRRSAVLYFSSVDTDLMDQCRELDGVGMPLAAVVEALV
jgi:hypothetical protein